MTDRELFKIIHSELIQQVQGIEYDLKVIYAAMKSGNFEDNFQSVKTMNLGKIISELKELDYSDNYPDLSESDYELLEEIREIRNYWCHQCYIDFMYIQNDYKREKQFQKIFSWLREEENRTADLFERLENFRLEEMARYRGQIGEKLWQKVLNRN